MKLNHPYRISPLTVEGMSSGLL